MSITFMNPTSQAAIVARSMILTTVIALAAWVFVSAECIGRQSWLETTVISGHSNVGHRFCRRLIDFALAAANKSPFANQKKPSL